MWSTIICMMCNGENFQISPSTAKAEKQMREFTRFHFNVPCQLCFSERERASVVVLGL